MNKNLKIIVINPPSEEHLEELCNRVREYIQESYYSK